MPPFFIVHRVFPPIGEK